MIGKEGFSSTNEDDRRKEEEGMKEKGLPIHLFIIAFSNYKSIPLSLLSVSSAGHQETGNRPARDREGNR